MPRRLSLCVHNEQELAVHKYTSQHFETRLQRAVHAHTHPRFPRWVGIIHPSYVRLAHSPCSGFVCICGDVRNPAAFPVPTSTSTPPPQREVCAPPEPLTSDDTTDKNVSCADFSSCFRSWINRGSQTGNSPVRHLHPPPRSEAHLSCCCLVSTAMLDANSFPA